MKRTYLFITKFILLFCVFNLLQPLFAKSQITDSELQDQRKKRPANIFAEKMLKNLSSNEKTELQKLLSYGNKNILSKKAGDKILQTAYTLLWNEETSVWDTSSKLTYTWNAGGEPLQIESFHYGGIYKRRTLFTGFIKRTEVNTGDDDIFLNRYDILNSLSQTWINDAWLNDSRNITTLSSDNLILEEISQEWENNSWENIDKVSYDYNSANLLIRETELNWKNNAWENDEKEEYYYDKYGRYQGKLESIWYDSEWLAVYGWKDEFSYDSNNNVIAALSSRYDTSWLPEKKMTYTLNAKGEITEAILTKLLSPGDWADVAIYKNISWQSFNKMANEGPVVIGGENYFSYDIYEWDGIAWSISKKFIKNYNSASLLTEELNIEQYNISMDTVYRRTITYYPNNDMKEYKSLGKKDGKWEVWYSDYYDNTYDTDGDILTRTFQSWSNYLQRYENKSRNIYVYGTSSAIDENNRNNKTSSNELKVFPNPSENGFVTVSTMGNDNSRPKSILTIYNQLGHSVIQKNIYPDHLLDISSLPKGIYIISLNDGINISTTSLIIR